MRVFVSLRHANKMLELFVSRSQPSVLFHGGISTPWRTASLARRANALRRASRVYKNPNASTEMQWGMSGGRGMRVWQTLAGGNKKRAAIRQLCVRRGFIRGGVPRWGLGDWPFWRGILRIRYRFPLRRLRFRVPREGIWMRLCLSEQQETLFYIRLRRPQIR